MATTALTASLNIDVKPFQQALQQAAGAAQSASQQITNSLTVKADIDTDKAESGLEKLKSSANGFGEAFKSAMGAVAAFNVAELGLSALKGLGDAVVGAGKKMIDTNKEFETFKTQLTTLTGSATIAEERIKELAKFGAETPFELPELVKAEKVLLGFGLTGQKALDMTGKSAAGLRTAIGDIAAGTGQTFEEVSLLFGKFSSGATGEAISRLQELGVVTREELKGVGINFTKAGELTSPIAQALPAALKIAGEKFGGGMKALSETAAGQLSTLQDNFDSFFRDIGAPIFDIFKDLVAGLNNFLGSQSFSGIKDSIGSVLKAISDFAKSAGGQFNSLMTAMKPFIDTVTTIIGGAFTTVWDVLKKAVGSTWEILQQVFTGLGRIIAPVVSAFTDLSGSGKSTADAFTVFGNALKGIIDISSSFLQIVIEIAVTVGETLATAITSVYRLFASWAQTLNNTFGITKMFSGLVQTLGEWFATLGKYVDAVLNVFRIFKDSVGAVFSVVSQALSSFSLERILNLPSQLAKIFTEGADKAANAWNTSLNQVGNDGAKIAQQQSALSVEAYKKIYEQVDLLKAQSKELSKQQILDTKKTITEQAKAALEAGQISVDQANEINKLVKRISEEGYKSAKTQIAALRKDIASGTLIEDDVKKQKDAIESVIEAELQKGKITKQERVKLYAELEQIEDQFKEAQKARESATKDFVKNFIKQGEEIAKQDKAKLEAEQKFLLAKEQRKATTQDELKLEEGRLNILKQELARFDNLPEAKIKTKEDKKSVADTITKIKEEIAKQEVVVLNITTKSDAEKRRADIINTAKDENELKKQLALLDLEERRKKELEAAGNINVLKLEAERKYQQDKAKIEDEYLRKTNTAYLLSVSFRETLSKRQYDSTKSVLENLGGLLSGTLEPVIAQQRDAVAKTNEQYVKLVQDANATDEARSQKVGELAIQTGILVGEQTAQLISNGENAGKAVAKTTFNTLQSMVPTLIAAIFGQSFAQLGPIGGALASAGTIAAFTGLLSAARSALGFEQGGYTGDNGFFQRPGEQTKVAGVVHTNEFVFDRFMTAKNRDVFEELHKNKMSVHEWAMQRYGTTAVAIDTRGIEARLDRVEMAVRNTAKQYSNATTTRVELVGNADGLLKATKAKQYRSMIR